MKTLSLFSASLLSLSLTACAQQPQQGDDLSNEDYDDIAAGVGAMVAMPGGGGEVDSFEDAVSTATTESSGSAIEGLGAHEIVVRAGITYEYRAECFDLDGNELEVCDETTDSASITVSWSGDIDTPRYDASIARSGEWSLSGLQSDTAVIAGNGSFEVDATFQAIYRDIIRSMRFSYDAEYRDVQVDTATKQAIGGSIAYSVRGERSAQNGRNERNVSFSVQAEVTFHADGTATLVIDGEHRYQIDVSSGVVAPEEPAAS